VTDLPIAGLIVMMNDRTTLDLLKHPSALGGQILDRREDEGRHVQKG